MAQLSFQSCPLFTMFCKDAEYMEPLYLTLKHVTFFKETPNEEINCIFKYFKPAVSFLNLLGKKFYLKNSEEFRTGRILSHFYE